MLRDSTPCRVGTSVTNISELRAVQRLPNHPRLYAVYPALFSIKICLLCFSLNIRKIKHRSSAFRSPLPPKRGEGGTVGLFYLPACVLYIDSLCICHSHIFSRVLEHFELTSSAKSPSDLPYHCPCPPARDWAIRVSVC